MAYEFFASPEAKDAGEEAPFDWPDWARRPEEEDEEPDEPFEPYAPYSSEPSTQVVYDSRVEAHDATTPRATRVAARQNK